VGKVLVIDDEPGIHRLIDEELFLQGIETENVLHACNGYEGVEKFILFNPVFTLLDMRMPGIDGLETYKLIKDRNPDANVILLTGYARDESTHEAIRIGIRGYISKNNTDYIKMVVSLIIPMLQN